MMTELRKINYLPKWYDKADLKVKQKEINDCRKNLLATNKLTVREIEDLEDMELALWKDTYSKNSQIRRINEIIDFVNCR